MISEGEMNQITTSIKLTDDGLTVPEHMVLRFNLLTHHVEDRHGLLIDLYWNQSGAVKRPYLLLVIGKHIFQSGWLWE